MDNVNVDHSNLKKKEPSVLWKFLSFLFNSLFPYFKFRIINKLLLKSFETYIPYNVKKDPKHPNYPKESVWFKKQIKWNLFLSLFIPLIYISGFFISKTILTTNPVIMKVIDISIKSAKQFNFKEIPNKIKLANSLDQNFSSDIKLALYIFSGSLLFSFILGSYVTYQNPLFKKTQEFKDVVINLGFLKKDEEAIVLYTEYGVLFKLSPGGSAREMVSQDRIWSALNIQIGEYLENPDNRQIVFFKKPYPLKEGMDYGYDKF